MSPLLSFSSRRRVAPVVAAAAAVLISAAAGIGAYSLYGASWSAHQMSYYVNAANLDMSEAEAEAAIRAGADAWSLQSDADFRFVYAGRTTGSSAVYNGKNEVFFRNESNGSTIATTYYWHDGAGHLLDADIVFYDGGMTFLVDGAACSSGIYLQDPATHEFGHALGLGHSSVTDATMAPSMAWCSTAWRSLASDDISGVEALYPPAGAAPAPPTAPTGLSVARSASSPTSALELAWSDTSNNEDSFLVERSSDGASFTQVAQLGANTVRYTATGLSASTTYWFRVRASNGGGFSGYSNTASGTTAAAVLPGAPGSPTPADGALGVSIDADLSWTCGGAETYEVYFGAGSLPPTPSATGLTSPSLKLPRLSSSTTYYWRVVARTSVGTTAGQTWSFVTGGSTKRKRLPGKGQ